MASKYMSPYMQNVVDVQKRKAREDAQQTQLAGNLGSSRQGTYGGSRQLLATMNRERDLATQMGDLQAKGSQDAYTAAMDQYRNEADRRLQAQQYGEQSSQFGATNALAAASQLGQLGTSQQSSDINRYAAMTGVGETERDLRQKGLDMQYRDFTDQRDYEKNQLRDYSDIVGAQPEGNRTESVYGQPANQTGALIGAAGSIGSAYMANRTSPKGQGISWDYNSGGLVALADGGGVDAGKQQGLAAIAGGNDGSKYKLRNDPKELLYSTMGDPAKLQALTQQGIDPTAVGIAAMLAKRIYDTQSMAMAPQQTTVAGLLNPMPPQGQPQQPQGQPQDQQGLAGIAPQGQPMGDPMQPPMGDPSMASPMQPPMDPMQAQGLEALTQQDQPMEEQPMEELMMAANGGLMNINLPDDYYDEDSYSHGGIAHFAAGDQALLDPFIREKRDTRPAYEVLGLNKPIEIASRASSNIDEKKKILDSLPESVRQKLSLLTLPELRGFLEKTTDQEFLPNVQEQPMMPRRDASIGSDKPVNIKGLEDTADAYLRPTPNVTGRSMMMPGKTAGMPEMQPEDDSNSIMNQYLSTLRTQYPGAPSSTEAAAPEQDFSAVYEKRLKEMQDAQSKPSKARDEYLAALNEQKPLEDTSKQDFWRTIGEMSSKLTEGSLEGKGLLEAAAGATSVLPGSVARSIENKKAREDAAKADRLTKLATMYGIDTNDRAAMADLAKTAFDMTEKQADRIETLRHNKEVERKGREDTDYERFMDKKKFDLDALEAQMKDGGGNKFTEIKRAYYDDLQTKYGMSSQEAAIETNRVFGQLGQASGTDIVNPSEMTSLKKLAKEKVFDDISAGKYEYGSPEMQEAFRSEYGRLLSAASLKEAGNSVFDEADDIMGNEG
jgi:hypothetical protein